MSEAGLTHGGFIDTSAARMALRGAVRQFLCQRSPRPAARPKTTTKCTPCVADVFLRGHFDDHEAAAR